MTEQELNKACEWLKETYPNYADEMQEKAIDWLIEDFRKAMGAVVKDSLTTELTLQDVQKIADIIGHTPKLTKEGYTRSPEDVYTEVLRRFKEEQA